MGLILLALLPLTAIVVTAVLTWLVPLLLVAALAASEDDPGRG